MVIAAFGRGPGQLAGRDRGSVLITPWNLYNNPDVIKYTLEVLGAFIGPLIADSYLLRKHHIVVSWMGTAAQYSRFIRMGLALVVYTVLGRNSAVTATSLVMDDSPAVPSVVEV